MGGKAREARARGVRAPRPLAAATAAAALALLTLGTAAGDSPPPSAAAGALGSYPSLGGCQLFPDPPTSLSPTAPSQPDQTAWNQDISRAPIAPNSYSVG